MKAPSKKKLHVQSLTGFWLVPKTYQNLLTSAPGGVAAPKILPVILKC
jgi:hypothetical protein